MAVILAHAVRWFWIPRMKKQQRAVGALPGREGAREDHGLEAVTWLIIVGVTIAGALAASIVYNAVLTAQSGRVSEQDIPCVKASAGVMSGGTLNTSGRCE